MVTKQLESLTPQDLENAKSALTMLRLLGLSDDDINALPEIISGYKSLKAKVEVLESRLGNSDCSPKPADIEKIASAVGFGIPVKQLDLSLGKGKVKDNG